MSDCDLNLIAGHLQATKLEQVANLLWVEVNSASYPQREEKWVAVYGPQAEGLVLLIGALVCLRAATPMQLFAKAGNG